LADLLDSAGLCWGRALESLESFDREDYARWLAVNLFRMPLNDLGVIIQVLDVNADRVPKRSLELV
jgi:hypothetical protein